MWGEGASKLGKSFSNRSIELKFCP